MLADSSFMSRSSCSEALCTRLRTLNHWLNRKYQDIENRGYYFFVSYGSETLWSSIINPEQCTKQPFQIVVFPVKVAVLLS
jgi:hypothetical protein